MAAVSLKDRLLQILVDGELVTEDQLSHALSIQKDQGGRLSEILAEQGYISETELMVTLSEHLGIPPINLSKIKIPESISSLISKQLARFYQVVPVSRMGNTLTVAMADPLNVFALDDLKMMTGMEIQPVISNPRDVADKLQEMYTPTAGLETLLTEQAAEQEVEIAKEGEEEIDVDSLLESSGDTSIIKIVNVILVQAIQESASDIHIEPFDKETKVRYRIDGVLYERTAPPKHMHAALVSRIKIMANLDIAERRLPQDGRFRIKLMGRDVDFRVSVLPTAFGEKVVMRILDKSALTLDISQLGFAEDALARFRSAISAPYGMVLVTGPTGSGKTTTLYSALNEINKPDVNIITVEDPIEYQLHGINQVQTNSEIEFTFAAGLRSILRQDPDIVMVGEIRDHETADIAVKAALTGHLVFSTLHTNDAAGAMTRLVDMGVEPFLISSSVLLVQAQRLVRRVCKHCRQEVEIDPDVLRRAQVHWTEGETPPTFWAGKGCSKCSGSGYAGRCSVMEVLRVNETIRSLVIKQANAGQIKAAALADGMWTMRMDAIHKAEQGITTLEEVLRVTAPDEQTVDAAV
ncbi:MAG: type IV-A pilus assembly ATPase PilB [Verrucomicrobia bacterium]|nr:type IV-A pilus assembly ATPase PilB [Verrucomicrobiota bacterium]